MNKYILADMVTERLKKEIGMVAKPLPEEIRALETVLPSGKVLFESALYQTEKLKKITIAKHTLGEGAGTLVLIVADDKYDLPFTLADIAFDFGKKGKILVDFEVKPLIKDEESMRKYVDPFRQWREALGKLTSEPATTAFEEDGEFLRANASPNKYSCLIPNDYTDEVLNFADQFFDIFLDIYRKAEPVKDAERRRKIDAFRSEYNKHVLDEDPSAIFLTNAFGRRTAELFYDYLVNM